MPEQLHYEPERERGMSEDFAQVVVDGHHIAYVLDGGITDRAPDMALGKLLMVFDRDGWATLHRIDGFKYPGRVSFGPRIPWPDGSIAARRVPAEPVVHDETEAKDVLVDILTAAPVHREEGKGSKIPRPPFRTPCQRCGALIPAWGVCPNPKCPGKRP